VASHLFLQDDNWTLPGSPAAEDADSLLVHTGHSPPLQPSKRQRVEATMDVEL
jgi:hypothetical protein